MEGHRRVTRELVSKRKYALWKTLQKCCIEDGCCFGSFVVLRRLYESLDIFDAILASCGNVEATG